ncbi:MULTISPECIES: BrnA antitoxin family protein [Thioalkalivibrio]|uniref:BrnA antitoxin of type II toxin-antitoxin system n=1 Tax=Thioalkalivibrio paradoxus ARh 1 TaxID=713585 RepID=W0DKS6_9GAMM|nr:MULTISPECIES: BrnA antitoxin family protein [Thioalkalivibrio]AHE97837.1 hypothetical protein THITH_05720 [Thioalkalivibrio paradoxus ARh 1]
MHLKTKSGRRVILPTPEEDAAITAAAADDPDNPVLSDDEWDEARLRAVRPEPDTGKDRVAVRLSEQVVQRFRATGSGWQGRMDAALQDWLKHHKPEQLP